jgi:hypothetical protein
MTEQWYHDKFRRTLLDMHIEDWDDRFLSEYDPDVYFKALKRAKITATMSNRSPGKQDTTSCQSQK